MNRLSAILTALTAILVGLAIGGLTGRHIGPGGGARPAMALAPLAEAPPSVRVEVPVMGAPLWTRRSASVSVPPTAPLVGVVLYGLDSAPDAVMAITRLKHPVTIGLSGHGPGAQQQIDALRRAGHEVLLSLDTGREAVGQLDARQTPAENRRRLLGMMRGLDGYLGVLDLSREPSRALSALIAEAAADRGLVMLAHAVPAGGVHPVPALGVTARIPPDAGDAEVRQMLDAARARARAWGVAVLLAPASDMVLDQLRRWPVDTVPVPLSGVLRRGGKTGG